MAPVEDTLDLIENTDITTVQHILIKKRINCTPLIEMWLHKCCQLFKENLSAEFITEPQPSKSLNDEKEIIIKELDLFKNKDLKNSLKKQISVMRIVSMKAKCPITAIVDDM